MSSAPSRLTGIRDLRLADGAGYDLALGTDGRISAIVTRAGELLGPALLAHYAGVRWMPESVIVGEVELWTEASQRAVTMRGNRSVGMIRSVARLSL